jgi:hypothetical protein
MKKKKKSSINLKIIRLFFVISLSFSLRYPYRYSSPLAVLFQVSKGINKKDDCGAIGETSELLNAIAYHGTSYLGQ